MLSNSVQLHFSVLEPSGAFSRTLRCDRSKALRTRKLYWHQSLVLFAAGFLGVFGAVQSAAQTPVTTTDTNNPVNQFTIFTDNNGTIARGLITQQNVTGFNTGQVLVQSSLYALQDIGTGGSFQSKQGFATISGLGSSDGIHGAPWYGIGQTDLVFGSNQSQYATQLAGYFGLNFQTANGQMVMRSDTGNVGINTTTPVEKLEVDGNLQLTGSIKFHDGTSLSSASGLNSSGGGSTAAAQSTFAAFAIPTVGTYLIAASPRLRGEYIFSVDVPFATQTVHLLVEANQFDGGSTLQILDNHSYLGNVILTNFRVLLSSNEAYLVVDVAGYVPFDNNAVLNVQYQGVPGYQDGFNTTGAAIPADAYQVGGVGLAVSDARVGIGTASPQNLLSVNGGLNLDQGDQSDGNPFINYYSSYGLTFGDATGEGISSARTEGSPNQYGLDLFTNFTNRVSLTQSGNLGVGTTSPGERLEINGNIKLSANTGGHVTFADGTVQSTAWTGILPGGDYAESVDVTGSRGSYQAGDLLVIDPEHPGCFLKSSQPYSPLIGGVYATKPGVTGRRQPREKSQDGEVPMAMVGIVPTKVSSENGPIKVGDLLVSSSRAGYAMKGTDRALMMGATVGKALAPLSAGEGTIEVLISLQ